MTDLGQVCWRSTISGFSTLRVYLARALRGRTRVQRILVCSCVGWWGSARKGVWVDAFGFMVGPDVVGDFGFMFHACVG